MRAKLKKISKKILFSILFYLSENIYILSLLFNEYIEKIQRKNWFKDRGEIKYDIEEMIRMSMTIPRYSILKFPHIKKLFPLLSKEHIYRIIDIRKKINKWSPDTPHMWEIQRKILFKDIT